MDNVTTREKRLRRRKNLCSRCGVNPRHVSRNGKPSSYCRSCGNAIQNKTPSTQKRRVERVPDVSVPHELKWFREVYDVLIKHPDFPDGRYIRYAVKTLLKSGELEFEMDARAALIVMYRHYPLPGEALNPFRKKEST